ncbi:MAG: site-specific integrase [Chthoniobacterales bacterium]
MTAMTAAAVVIPFPQKRQRRARNSMTFLTPDEILRVLRVAKERSARDHAMILLGYRHGMRASEVCGLKLREVDLKNLQIEVNRLKNSLRTVQPLDAHKGDNRSVFDEIVVLKRWLAERVEDGSGYVFLSQKGGALSRKQFYATFRAIALAAGIAPEKAHPHTLKHSRATNLIAAKVGLMEVKALLGHKSISSTVQYIGVSDQQAAEAAKRADAEMF